MNQPYTLFISGYRENKFLNIDVISHYIKKYEYEIFDNEQNISSGTITFKISPNNFMRPMVCISYNPLNKYFIKLVITFEIHDGYTSKTTEKIYTIFFDEYNYLQESQQSQQSQQYLQ